MDRLKRFVECYIGTETCNLRCHYCYITLQKAFNNRLVKFEHSPDVIRKALSYERLGGACLFNMCAGGETLLGEDVIPVIRALLEEGHYVSVVTNGTLTNRFEKIAQFPKELLARLFFKFSFHYLELKRLDWMERYFENVERMRAAGCSYTVELTPSDELIPYIDEVKKVCMEKMGTLCHVTIARDDRTGGIDVLSERDWEDYKKIWGGFGSDLFEFKTEIYHKKRKEFCYAGDWSVYVNLSTGSMRQCYCGKELDNIYSDIEKPLHFEAIGHGCELPYCYNGHGFLTLGVIPELDTVSYAAVRNRKGRSGQEWLKEPVKSFFGQKLGMNNKEYSEKEKKRIGRAVKVKRNLQNIRKRLGAFKRAVLGTKMAGAAKKLYIEMMRMSGIMKVRRHQFIRKWHMRLLFWKKGRHFVLIGSPFHGNLGDHAISEAEIDFLNRNFSKNPVIEVGGEELSWTLSFLKKMVKKDDVILVTGGGFLGSLWIAEEERVRTIIGNFMDNKIVIMPQTIFYENTREGAAELKKTKDIYERHPDLGFLLREKTSYEFARKEFPFAKFIKCVPDMVLYTNREKTGIRRNGVLLCFRSDKEKVLKDEMISCLEQYLEENGLNYYNTTTVENRRISFGQRKCALEAKLDEFRGSRLVITDRLHGMIFAAVTGTPCIAFDNVSGKVGGVYEWLKNLDYIEYVKQDDKNICPIIQKMLCIKDSHYQESELEKEWEEIRLCLKGRKGGF